VAISSNTQSITGVGEGVGVAVGVGVEVGVGVKVGEGVTRTFSALTGGCLEVAGVESVVVKPTTIHERKHKMMVVT
jgi:hypothetical protein